MQKSTHSREYEFVLKKLVDMRHKAKLTQRELAKRLNREPSFVWRIEKGERRLDVLEFYWVCHALDVDPASTYSELCASFRAC
ncbi:MAG: helix-turn-helix transcriptional regulator [bacterium]